MWNSTQTHKHTCTQYQQQSSSSINLTILPKNEMAIAILNLLNETGPSSYRLYIIRCSSLWLLLLVVSIACVCVLCGFLFCTFSATQFSIWPKFVSSTAHNTQHTHVVPANSYIVKYISFSNALPNNKQKRVVLKAVQGKNEFSNAMNS